MTRKLTDAEIGAIVDGCEGVADGGGWVHYRAKLRPNFGGIINEVQTRRKPNDGRRHKPIVAWGGFDSNDRTEAQNALIAAHIARCDPATIRAAMTELLELRTENEEETALRVLALDNMRAAEAQAKALRDALRPFVSHYGDWMDHHPDDRNCSTYPIHTFGQIRRALTALGETQ